MTASQTATHPKRKRVGVLISGRGSNMMSLVEASQNDPDAGYDIVLIVANDPNAAGLKWAADKGIATQAVPHGDYTSREDFEDVMHEALISARVEIVACAGFMRILTDRFVKKWQDKMLNIHPSLLPSFKGINTHQRALDAGVKIAGCTVHIVRPELDSGPILGQAAVPTEPGDTADRLASRIIKAEHRLYPEILKRFARGEFIINGETTCDKSVQPSARILFSPDL